MLGQISQFTWAFLWAFWVNWVQTMPGYWATFPPGLGIMWYSYVLIFMTQQSLGRIISFPLSTFACISGCKHFSKNSILKSLSECSTADVTPGPLYYGSQVPPIPKAEFSGNHWVEYQKDSSSFSTLWNVGQCVFFWF